MERTRDRSGTFVWWEVIAALGLTLSTAQAAAPVLYTGDAATALSRIGSNTETRAHYLEPVSVEALLAETPPYVDGDATLVPCEGRSVDAEWLRGEAERLYAAIVMGLAPQRGEVARQALTQLACLEGHPDPSQAARLLSLAGVVSQLAGDDVAAERAHVTARAFDPGVTWNPDWPSEAQVGFDRAMVVALVEEPVPLEWHPLEAIVWVDGQKGPPEGVEVVPGLHLVQWGEPVRSLLVDVRGETSVVLPSEFEPVRLLEGPGAYLGPIIDHALGEQPGAYVVTSGGIYSGYARTQNGQRIWTWTPVEGVTWEPQPEPEPEPEPVVEDPEKRRRKRARLVALGVGAGILVAVPVAAALASYLSDRQDARSGESDDARHTPVLTVGGRF